MAVPSSGKTLPSMWVCDRVERERGKGRGRGEREREWEGTSYLYYYNVFSSAECHD